MSAMDDVKRVSRREFFERSAGASAVTVGAARSAKAFALQQRDADALQTAGPAPRDASTSWSATASAERQDHWFSNVPVGRSVVRASHAMVASSQPLASMVGLDVLKRGGNAVDASIAMAAVLNVTEPNMTGVGGDAFMMIYSAKTKKLEGLNASGRAPRALNLDYFTSRKISQMPTTGMEPVTVPGAFDGWVTLLDTHGTMKLAELLAPAIDYAENGFAVMEKTAADWVPEIPRLKQTPAAAATYVVNGDAPKPGAIFYQKNLARTLRTLARGGRDAFGWRRANERQVRRSVVAAALVLGHLVRSLHHVQRHSVVRARSLSKHAVNTSRCYRCRPPLRGRCRF